MKIIFDWTGVCGKHFRKIESAKEAFAMKALLLAQSGGRVCVDNGSGTSDHGKCSF